MTIDLPHVLRLFLSHLPARRAKAYPPLDLSVLGPRGLADLNLPGDVAARLAGRYAEDMRRRSFL